MRYCGFGGSDGMIRGEVGMLYKVCLLGEGTCHKKKIECTLRIVKESV